LVLGDRRHGLAPFELDDGRERDPISAGKILVEDGADVAHRMAGDACDVACAALRKSSLGVCMVVDRGS
jgi:hypothetical protein